MGALVAAPTESAEVTEVRFAESASGLRTARWASLHVVGSAASFAWIVPVTGSAYVDATSDAWLEALEAATAPRIVPPGAPPPCGQAGGVDTEGTLDHVSTLAPTSVTVAPDGATLSMVLAMDGFAPDPALTSALATTSAVPGTAFVVLVYANPPADAFTQTIRVVDANPPDVPLSLVQGASPSTTVTAYLFSAAGTVVPDVTVDVGTQPVLWTGYGTSNYGPLSAASLYSTPGSWVVDTASHGVVFGATALPAGQIVPALDTVYFGRAATYGDLPDASGCLAGATQAAASSASQAFACPAGALARVSAGGCEEAVAPGEVDPGLLRCGGTADDLAVALSGLPPGSAWLTRARTVVLGGSLGSDHSVQPTPGAPLGPVFSASAYAFSCETPVGSTGGGAGGGSPPPASSGSSTSTGTGTAAGDLASGVADAAASSDGCSCGSDNGSEGDSSGSCGGDSSSSDGGGCSGGSSGGDSGGGCGSGSNDCATADRRHGRSGFSRMLMALAVAAALARRSRRARR